MRSTIEVFSKFIFWFENTFYIFALLVFVPFLLYVIIGPLFLIYAVLNDMFLFIKTLCDYKDEDDQY